MSHEVLAELREQARRLVAEVGGPLSQVRLRDGDHEISIEWHAGTAPAAVHTEQALVAPAPLAPLPLEAPDDDVVVVTSPIVGTFYRAPEPGAANFVEVGDLVEAGQPVGIVEAMKLMNHIVAERSGVVAEVLVANGKPVEFEQPLIVLQPE
jgi:acetyl-CoA carboxylase biotin carboxyl carrier protein